MMGRSIHRGVALGFLAVLVGGSGSFDATRLPGTIATLLDLDIRPFAIAHHGFGTNRG